jgi:two-component system sensor histidine kinase AlgZ
MFKINPSIAKTAVVDHRHDDSFFLPRFAERHHLANLLISTNLVAIGLYLVTLVQLKAFEADMLLRYVFFANWVAVCGALLTDALRPLLVRLDRRLAMGACLLVFEAVVLLLTLMAHWVMDLSYLQPWDWGDLQDDLLRHALLVGLGGGMVLYHLYMRERELLYSQSELKLRVQALQARIRPHFLFNSMNSLSALIGMDNQRAEQAVHDLSALFRASLNAQGEIPLQDELALCERYLALEKLRLGERLQVEWQLPDEDTLYDLMIPALTLQPLFENAVYHGVESRQAPSLIRLLVAVKDGQVQIVMTNPVQAGKKIRMGNQLALQNIQERLLAYYGASAYLRTHVSEQSFTVILGYPSLADPHHQGLMGQEVH